MNTITPGRELANILKALDVIEKSASGDDPRDAYSDALIEVQRIAKAERASPPVREQAQKSAKAIEAKLMALNSGAHNAAAWAHAQTHGG